MAANDPIHTGTAPRSAARPAVVSIVLSPSSARKNATATLISPRDPAPLATSSSSSAAVATSTPRTRGTAGRPRRRSPGRARPRLTSAPTVTDSVWSTAMAAPSTASTFSGGVAARQGERDELGLVAELGQEHDHEGGRDITHGYAPCLAAGTPAPLDDLPACARCSASPPLAQPSPRAAPAGTTAGRRPRRPWAARTPRTAAVTLVADDLRWDTDCLRAEPRPAHHRGRQPRRRCEPQRPPAGRARLAGHRARAGPVTQELDVDLAAGQLRVRLRPPPQHGGHADRGLSQPASPAPIPDSRPVSSRR